jgi:GTP-binding protein
LSRARPEIADYPFTTKHPNLGIVRIDQDQTFVLADIPGLIEGAHSGHGLGHEFLRHIERAGILVHLVEPEPSDETDPISNYRTIREELVQYDAKLGERPEILVVTKAELPSAAEVREKLAEVSGKEVLLVSAVTGQGLNQLLHRMGEALNGQHQVA